VGAAMRTKVAKQTFEVNSLRA